MTVTFGNCKLLVLAATFAAGLTPQPLLAVSEEGDTPFPDISVDAQSDALPVPEDLPTKANTRTYPLPATRAVPAFPATRQPQGALSGRIIFTSGGHGWQWSDTLNRFATDRGNNNGVIEDFGNQDQMTQFVYQAFNAGATIVPFRPVGNQVNEVVMDNDSPGVTWFGTWTDNTAGAGIYFGQSADTIKYRFAAASSNETAVARYTPAIPQQGYYPVYTWVLDSSNRCVDQLYRVAHTGGVSEVRGNHRRVGKGWVYLGTYYFAAGSTGYVEISNQSSNPSGSNAIADAIRFGNGMGTALGDNGQPSGRPREEEGCIYWIQGMRGINASSTPGSGNVSGPPRMSAYMNREADGARNSRLMISFHSNAGGGRGADGLYNDPVERPGTNTTNQYRLAVLLGREVNQDMFAIGSPPLEVPWSVPPNEAGNAWRHPDYAFGELRADYINNEMDATIIEVAYHDSVADANLMRDPKARIWIARAVLQGAMRYFNEFDGLSPLIFPPDPPTHVRAVATPEGHALLHWTAPPGTNVGGGSPTSYVVYRSNDGYGFGNPVPAEHLTTLITNIPANQVTYFRIAAVNAGGESLPSEVIAVRPSGLNSSKVMIVNGFDRIDRFMNPQETGTALGTYDRVKPWVSNNADYVVQHAKALHAANVSFDSTSNEALTQGILNGYQAAVWITGEESRESATFDAAEQGMLTNFLNSGKNLFVSGAEVGWDLDAGNTGRTFYRSFFGATYLADDANTYSMNPGTGIFAGAPAFSFATPSPTASTIYPPLDAAPYNADFCDTVTPAAGAATLQTYSTGGVAAVAAPSGTGKVVYLAYPFECAGNEVARNVMMQGAMSYFNVTASESDVEAWKLY